MASESADQYDQLIACVAKGGRFRQTFRMPLDPIWDFFWGLNGVIIIMIIIIIIIIVNSIIFYCIIIIVMVMMLMTMMIIIISIIVNCYCYYYSLEIVCQIILKLMKHIPSMGDVGDESWDHRMGVIDTGWDEWVLINSGSPNG